MLITIITLVVAAAFFVWGRIRSDVVALIALMVLTLSGILTTEEALSGFANPIVIMMIGLFVVGGAIFNTGLAKMIGARLLKLAGNSETKLFLLVMGGTALIGGFVSNTGTVALMLPIVVSMAAGLKNGASRLLMPLAFASSLGGMMTLIGTPPNLVIAGAWESLGNEPLSFFTFLPAGLICLIAGTLLLIPLSKKFLTKKSSGDKDTKSGKSKTIAQLVDEYGLNADLCGLQVSENSLLIGKNLAELNIRQNYEINVLEVRSGDEQRKLLKKVSHRAADPTIHFTVGETIYARGTKENIARFVKDFNLTQLQDNQLQFYEIGIAEIVLMPGSSIINRTIADVGFRDKYGVNVVGIRRKSNYITSHLGHETIHSGDVLLVQGSWDAIGELSHEDGKWVVLGQPLAEASKVTLDYKAPLAAAIMLAMVVALIFGFVPSVVTVIVAALLMVLTGCFRNVEDAYKTINWESIVLIGAMMPMSFALDKTGVSAAVSGSLVGSLGQFGPLALLAGVYFTTSLMTMFISNTAKAVLLAPIAVESALAFNVSPLPFLFAVSFGASLCFASPFSTPPNALVMPAGEYKFADYVKVGLPLQLILGILMILVLPIIFPF